MPPGSGPRQPAGWARRPNTRASRRPGPVGPRRSRPSATPATCSTCTASPAGANATPSPGSPPQAGNAVGGTPTTTSFRAPRAWRRRRPGGTRGRRGGPAGRGTEPAGRGTDETPGDLQPEAATSVLGGDGGGHAGRRSPPIPGWAPTAVSITCRAMFDRTAIATRWTRPGSWSAARSLQEPDVPSWAAMTEGERERSLVLGDETRAGIAEHQRRLDARGTVQRPIQRCRASAVGLSVAGAVRPAPAETDEPSQRSEAWQAVRGDRDGRAALRQAARQGQER